MCILVINRQLRDRPALIFIIDVTGDEKQGKTRTVRTVSTQRLSIHGIM